MTVMDRERWRVIEPLLDEVLDLPSEERARWLDALSGAHPAMAAEVSALLRTDAVADLDGFLERAVEVSLAGMRIGAYVLDRALGQGGMGSVWLAHRADGRFEGLAAVKLLNLSLSSALGQERFRREGSMLARLAHPGIARLLDAGVSGSGQLYLVLEYVDGIPIDRYVAERALSVDERVALLLNVMDAVGHAHANLIVHRDLKPSNILVTADGTAKLLDFGIGKLLDMEPGAARMDVTLEGGRAFTPTFAAPEQAAGGAITTAVDVYACGVLLYLLLSGRHPTAEGCRSQAEVLRALAEREPSPVGVDDLDPILAAALRKEPGERYGSIAAFAEDLRRWGRHEAVSARAPSAGYRARLMVRRHRAMATGMLLAGIWMATVLVDRQRVRRALAEATTSARTAEQVTDFAVGLFERGDGGTAFSDSVTARALLSRAVVHAHELAPQPAIEAQMLDLIGRIRAELGDRDSARAALDEALAIRRRSLGDEHPDVATSLMHLAALAPDAGSGDTTDIPLLTEALTLRTRLFGATDPRTTDALYALATARHVAGDYGGARPLYERWMSAVATQPRQLTPARAEQLSSISYILEFSRQLPRAERLAREALALERTLYGARHHRVGVELSHLGGILTDLHRDAEADSALRESVSILRASFPDGHAELANALRNLGYALIATRRWEEADATWREALLTYRRSGGEGTLGYANAAVNLGAAQLGLERWLRAESTLRDALRLPANVRSPKGPVAVRARMYLGEALRGQGRLSEAEPLLLEGFRTVGRAGLASSQSAQAAEALAKLYDARGQPAEAARYRVALRAP